jgi:hypothetical protein
MADLDQALALIIAERDRLNRAIEALQGNGKRRGRPPKNAVAASPAAKTRKPRSAASRKAQAERMKAYWAARKKAAAKSAKA